jgi:Flp pilus assembly protein TadB
VSLVAAVLLGALTWMVVRRLLGRELPRQDSPAQRFSLGKALAGRRGHRKSFQVWLSQAGAAVTPGQFWAVSTGVGFVTFVALLALSGTVVVSALPAVALAATPYAYWSAQRRKQAAARSAAWPDALRYLVGVLGAGVATLHDALEELAKSGPEPLRPPISRYVRMSARVGDRQALEAVRADLADPISDPVLLAFEGAVEEGTETVLHVLTDLSAQITSDLQLAEKIRTLQTQSRAATWGCFALPYVVLLFLCATNSAYRQFFATPFGLVLVLIGASLSLVGLLVCRRLLHPTATSDRVFERSWAQ